MTDVSPAFIKGLFAQLVKAVGGNDAAGAYLGVCHQRVSQLKRADCADMPTIIQMVTLQLAIGNPSMTDALSDLVTGRKTQRELPQETRELLHAVSDLDRLAVSGAPERAMDEAVAMVQRELGDVVRLRAANE